MFVCGAWSKGPQEKQTDVNIATHLLLEAVDDCIDTVVLVSAGSDLTPALQAVQTRFGLRLVLVDSRPHLAATPVSWPLWPMLISTSAKLGSGKANCRT